MLLIIIGFGLAALCAVLKKTYTQTGKGQKFSAGVTPDSQRAMQYITAHKPLASIFLDTLAAAALSLTAVLLALSIGLSAIAVMFVIFLLVATFVPELKSSKISKKLAYALSPAVRVCLEKLQPLSSKAGKLDRFRKQQTDSGVYTREDLREFIKRQKQSDNNMISDEELDALELRIEFEDKKAKDVLEPKRKAKIIGASEQIGPVLINELHETGRQHFLVEEEFNNEIIGTLNVAELVDLKQTGDVKSAMSDKLYYLNEKNTLAECLDGFHGTGSAVFVVVNSDEDITGILDINDVLRELTGREPLSEFDLYDSREAVAEGRHDTHEA